MRVRRPGADRPVGGGDPGRERTRLRAKSHTGGAVSEKQAGRWETGGRRDRQVGRCRATAAQLQHSVTHRRPAQVRLSEWQSLKDAVNFLYCRPRTGRSIKQEVALHHRYFGPDRTCSNRNKCRYYLIAARVKPYGQWLSRRVFTLTKGKSWATKIIKSAMQSDWRALNSLFKHLKRTWNFCKAL